MITLPSTLKSTPWIDLCDDDPPVKYVPKPYVPETKSKKKHDKYYRVCFSVVNNVECIYEQNGEVCKYAHTLEQFTPKICKFDTNCKTDMCQKHHRSKENKIQLLRRIRLLPPQWSDETTE